METKHKGSEVNSWLEERSREVGHKYRLGYHVMAPAGWINDPNGFSFFNDEYHLFYQHYPYDSQWGPMHWGHVTSKDLVHWVYRPVALTPGDSFDRNGCFSGSAVNHDGVLTLIYTGHVYNHPDEKDLFTSAFTETQNVAVSEDGIHFKKLTENPVIATPPEDNTQNFRDPKVWKHGDDWYMIVGGESKEHLGRVLLYRSPDLKKWTFEGVTASSDGFLGNMWECPDFFELDGRQVLLFSPVGMKADGDRFKNVFQTGYLIGDFDYDTHFFKHGDFYELDNGHDFYATQTMLSPDGRRIVIGWMDMWQRDMPESSEGWAGALTLPRELHVSERGKLIMTPIRELESLRKDVIYRKRDECTGELPTGVREKQSEWLISIHPDQASGNSGFLLKTSGETLVSVLYDQKGHKVTLNRTGDDGERAAYLEPGDQVDFHVYLDTSSIEIFINNGEASLTSRFYAEETPELILSGGTDKSNMDVTAYALNSIW